jgi:protein-S-isoprenylcysteine O-methyltransferase Ste14
MQRPAAILGSAIFFVVAPLMLGGFVPWWLTDWWQFRPPLLGIEAGRWLGVLLIIAGVPGLVHSFAQFALKGLGTPAPIAPTQHLVVSGLYRYLRNPMYVALVCVIFGQALLFGDVRVLIYGALFWLTCHVFVLAYEEPTLTQTFGSKYERFKESVPRWIPRLTPWDG